MNVGVEHQLVTNFAVGVSYHRRQHRQGLGLIDTARPAEAFTPEARTFVDPEGQTQSITLYKLLPEFGTLQNRVITNVDVLESDYNGVTFDVQKKMSNRWQMLAGLTIQRHRGFDHSGTFTQGGDGRRLRRAQRPELPDQPRRRRGLHRRPVGVQPLRQLPDCRGGTSRSPPSTTPATATRSTAPTCSRSPIRR